MQFSSFDVENRPRVKCVSAHHGIPVSTQWDKRGYYYATQICQYALSHWSKLLGDEEKATVIEDGNQTFFGAFWSGSVINRVSNDKCVHFDQPMTLHLDGVKASGQLVLSFELLVRDKPTVTVDVSHPEKGRYSLKYTAASSDLITRSARVITFGFNDASQPLTEGTWKSFTRNIVNDLLKGVPLDPHSKTLKQGWTIESLSADGIGCITNISLAKSRHERMFFHAADWLLESQDKEYFGWPVSVRFNLKKSKYPFASEIAPGWLSAMGSSHAISVLTRAYHRSGKDAYLNAAVKALKPFSISTKDNPKGFKSVFMDTYVWYEEYPTNPNSFVLNGFMYSLLGLYDLKQTLDSMSNMQESAALADSLFREGIQSLVSMLPFFDTGSGTVYDLRHLTMSGPPKLARWDYHSTHVNLLLVLSTIMDDPKKRETVLEIADRWKMYMVGQRSEHN